MGKKIIIKNPIFNAILYDICFNYPQEDIKKLPIKYRKMFASQVKVKNFCENGTMDEKIIFLDAIGLDFGLNLIVDKTKIGVSLQQIWDNLHANKLSVVQKKSSELGVYVTTSKDMAFYMGLVGQTINNETYLKTLEFNKTGYNLKGWTKQLSSQSVNDFSELVDNAKFVNKTLLECGKAFDLCLELYGINDVEMKVLLFLYQKRHLYVEEEMFYLEFSDSISGIKVKRALKRLQLNGYSKKHIDKSFKYTITAQGIKTVYDFTSQILKQ